MQPGEEAGLVASQIRKREEKQNYRRRASNRCWRSGRSLDLVTYMIPQIDGGTWQPRLCSLLLHSVIGDYKDGVSAYVYQVWLSPGGGNPLPSRTRRITFL